MKCINGAALQIYCIYFRIIKITLPKNSSNTLDHILVHMGRIIVPVTLIVRIGCGRLRDDATDTSAARARTLAMTLVASGPGSVWFVSPPTIIKW